MQLEIELGHSDKSDNPVTDIEDQGRKEQKFPSLNVWKLVKHSLDGSGTNCRNNVALQNFLEYPVKQPGI